MKDKYVYPAQPERVIEYHDIHVTIRMWKEKYKGECTGSMGYTDKEYLKEAYEKLKKA